MTLDGGGAPQWGYKYRALFVLISSSRHNNTMDRYRDTFWTARKRPPPKITPELVCLSLQKFPRETMNHDTGQTAQTGLPLHTTSESIWLATRKLPRELRHKILRYTFKDTVDEDFSRNTRFTPVKG